MYILFGASTIRGMSSVPVTDRALFQIEIASLDIPAQVISKWKTLIERPSFNTSWTFRCLLILEVVLPCPPLHPCLGQSLMDDCHFYQSSIASTNALWPWPNLSLRSIQVFRFAFHTPCKLQNCPRLENSQRDIVTEPLLRIIKHCWRHIIHIRILEQA